MTFNQSARRRIVAGLSAMVVAVAFASRGWASPITFITPAGATDNEGQPVDASVTINVSAFGITTIALTNLEANLMDQGQLVSDLTVDFSNELFHASSEPTIPPTSTLSFFRGDPIPEPGEPLEQVPWDIQTPLTAFPAGVLTLNSVTPGMAPQDLIIGPPGPDGGYFRANNTILGSSNPFIDQTANFNLLLDGVTPFTITGVTFSFGVPDSIFGISNVTGVPPPTTATPEPSSIYMFTIGVFILGGMWYMRRRKNNQTA